MIFIIICNIEYLCFGICFFRKKHKIKHIYVNVIIKFIIKLNFIFNLNEYIKIILIQTKINSDLNKLLYF